jgi:hypothetical protein
MIIVLCLPILAYVLTGCGGGSSSLSGTSSAVPGVTAAAAVVPLPTTMSIPEQPVEPVQPANKKALLIGCNYTGTSNALQGCINDIHNLKTRLQSTYGFPSSNIDIMTDNTAVRPNKANIRTAFTNLLKSGSPGDVLFFAYSGHGSHTFDRSGDEGGADDSVICPLDFNSSADFIVDDELKALLQAHLKAGVTLMALFDSCFSGSVLDLGYTYFNSAAGNTATMNTYQSETVGNVIMISGCMDNQTSADAFIAGKNQGAMMWSFLDTVRPGITWKDLITTMRTKLAGQYTQIPQLSSGRPCDINSTICF